MATMTSFHAEKFCRLASEYEASIRICLCSCLSQFLIYCFLLSDIVGGGNSNKNDDDDDNGGNPVIKLLTLLYSFLR